MSRLRALTVWNENVALAMAFLILYSGFWAFGHAKGWLPENNRLYGLIFALLLPILLREVMSGVVSKAKIPLMLASAFIVITGASTIFVASGGQLALDQSKKYLYFAVAFVLFFFLTTAVERSGRRVGVWFALTGCLSAVLVWSDFLNPLLFWSPFDEEWSGGRAKGLQLNPNGAGLVLLTSLVFGLGEFRASLRMPYLVFVASATVLTLSRGAILSMVLVIAGLATFGRIGSKALIVGAAAAMVSILFLAILFSSAPNLAEWYGDRNVERRASFFTGSFANLDESDRVRLEVIDRGWEVFAKSPFVGNGVGAALDLGATEGQSTHNQYLFFMIEFGALGALFFPMMVLGCASNQRLGLDGAMFATSMLALGFVSHNLMDDPAGALPFAYIAARSRFRAGGPRISTGGPDAID